MSKSPMTNTTSLRHIPQTLAAEHTSDGWIVRDVNGGVWRPSEEAAAEIAAAEHPDVMARYIATYDPMRGTWHQ